MFHGYIAIVPESISVAINVLLAWEGRKSGFPRFPDRVCFHKQRPTRPVSAVRWMGTEALLTGSPVCSSLVSIVVRKPPPVL